MAYSVTRSNHTQASHFRAALDGAPAAPGAKPRPRLGAALAALDVPALALSDDADAHRRLYELAVATADPAFPAPARAAKANVHLGRLAAWCVAAANCRDALLRARHTTPQPPRGPPASAVVAAGERAVKRWLRLCAPGGASPEKPPEKPPQAMTTPSRFAQTRRRRRPAPSCPPPSTPSLRAIFDASKSKPVPRGADCAQTLRKFYAIHNPSLLPRAAQIAREWRGSEETLFALLRYKYGSGTSSKPLALALDAAETAKPRRRRSMSVVPAREGPRDRAEALRTLRAEVERLKALEEENAAKVEREKRRANYASQRAKSLKEERDDAIEKAAEVTTLRRESAKLRENESKRLVELERLQKALEREREASSARTPASPSKPARDLTEPETVAVDAVLAALADVLVAECATEVEFELEFGLSEAQLLGLAPLPELPSTVPEEPARPSLEEQIVAGRQNLRRARSASPPARRDVTESPATLLRGWAREQAPSSGSSKASPTLRDLETTFRSLSSELSPSTAQGVLDGLESPLDGLVR